MSDQPKSPSKPRDTSGLRRGNPRSGTKTCKDGLSAGRGVPAYRLMATQDLSRFCAELFVCKSSSKAAIAIGKSADWGVTAMRHPEFLATYEAIAQKLTAKIIDKTAKRFVMSVEYVDEKMRDKMDHHQTHERMGDMDFAKMAEVAYKRIGVIQPARVINNNSAAAIASSTALQVYESQWLVQKRQQMAAQLEAKYPDGLPPSSPA